MRKSRAFKLLADRLDSIQEAVSGAVGGSEPDRFPLGDVYALAEWKEDGWHILPSFVYITEEMAKDVAEMIGAKNGRRYTPMRMMVLSRPL